MLSLKFVGLTVPEISLIMCLSINGPGDLELRPFDLKTDVSVTCVLGYLLPILVFLALLVLELFTMYATDRQTKAMFTARFPTGWGIINDYQATAARAPDSNFHTVDVLRSTNCCK